MNATANRPGRRHVWGIQLRLLVGFIVVGLAIGLLVARGARKSMVYYVTVTELLAAERTEDRDGLRVTGTVVPGTIDSQPMNLRFRMTDGSKVVPVEYKGIVPDTFGEKGEVVVEGCYRANGVFEANFLMAKCPSKYEMSPDEEMPANMPRTATAGSAG